MKVQATLLPPGRGAVTPLHQFSYKDNYLVSKTGKVLEVPDNKDNEGEKVQAAARDLSRTLNLNQKWNIIYVDGKDGKPGKGPKDYEKEWGFEPNRPFYIVSRSYMKRVITAQANKIVYMKNRNDDDEAQQWTFDPVSKTIRNVKHTKEGRKFLSLDIRNSNNLYLYETDSRWYQMFRYNGKNVEDAKE
jgi:hypothetical protein